MKLPNGYGSVYKLSGKRRNPWAARKTVGWKENGQPIYQFVGYYPTRAEALTALSDYNKDPYDLHIDTLTLAELYDRWSAEHYETVSDSNVKGCKAAWRLLDPLKGMRVAELKLDHFQKVVDDSGKNSPTLKKLKVTLGLMYEYAVRHEILDQSKRDMIRYIDVTKAGNPNAFNRKPFSTSEVASLWDNKDANIYLTVPLMLIYTGLRIGELLELKKKYVHLDERWFYVSASKTAAGIRYAYRGEGCPVF